jgi:glycosyltransferase involved in cell wall biosynthesis
MKISLVNLNLIGPDAIGSLIIQQARALMARGDDVRIYVESAPRDIPADIAEVCRVVALSGLVRQQSGLGEREDVFFSLSDLVIYHYPLHYDLLETIHARERGAVVFSYYCVTPPELASEEEERARLVRGRAEAAHAHCADLVTVLSPFGREELVAGHGVALDRIRILPPFVRQEAFVPGPPPGELVRRYGLQDSETVVSVGRFARNKDIETLIRAIAVAAGRRPRLRLLLVGDNQTAPVYRANASRYDELARSLGIADRVVAAGVVDDLPAHYRLAQAFATASRHEGFCVPVLEAMSCGIPVVAANAAALPHTAGDAAELFAPGDPHDLARALLGILDNAQRREDLVRRGFRRAAAFGVGAYESRVLEIVDEVTTGVPRLSRLITSPPLVQSRPRVVIAGTGVGGMRAAGLEARAGRDVLAFADNDRAKQGGRFLGKAVMAPDQAAALGFDEIVVCGTHRDAFRKQFVGLGVAERRIRTTSVVVPDRSALAVPHGTRIREALNGGRSSGRARRIVIFGTGAAGQQAYQQLHPKAAVIAFADNDTRKHGSVLHGLPVVAPDTLRSQPRTRVVIASMHWPEIRKQLLGMGVDERRIEVHGQPA